MTSNLIPEANLGDDESTLTALRPTFMKLAHALNELVSLQFKRFREKRKLEREAYASAVEV